MKYWIKRGGRIFGVTVFFIVLMSMAVRSETWVFPNYLSAFICAFAAGLISWFIGAVICDILLKGIIADFGGDRIDSMVEGGMVQRLQVMKEEFSPGGAEMPFVSPAPQAHGAMKKKKGKG